MRRNLFAKNYNDSLEFGKQPRGSAKFGVTRFTDWSDGEKAKVGIIKLKIKKTQISSY